MMLDCAAREDRQPSRRMGENNVAEIKEVGGEWNKGRKTWRETIVIVLAAQRGYISSFETCDCEAASDVFFVLKDMLLLSTFEKTKR